MSDKIKWETNVIVDLLKCGFNRKEKIEFLQFIIIMLGNLL